MFGVPSPPRRGQHNGVTAAGDAATAVLWRQGGVALTRDEGGKHGTGWAVRDGAAVGGARAGERLLFG